MTRPSFLSVALAGVIVLVLGTSVYTGFERVRFRVVTVPMMADEASVSIPLPDLRPLAASPAALVLRLRGGSEPAVVRVSLDGDPVADVGLARGQEVRIDAPVRVQGNP